MCRFTDDLSIIFTGGAYCQAGNAFYASLLSVRAHGETDTSLLFIKAHCEADALLLEVDIKDLYIHNVAYAYRLKRMLDVTVGDAGNVYQAVLVNADVHEHTEVDDVTYCAL